MLMAKMLFANGAVPDFILSAANCFPSYPIYPHRVIMSLPFVPNLPTGHHVTALAIMFRV